jgi:hypothetical protein
MLASGDDDGGIKLWDTRTDAAPALHLSGHDDVITDFAVDEGRATLLAASGDGTLGVFDLRKAKRAHVTEQLEDELLSVGIVKGGAAVVAGTQDGALYTWEWGHWGDDEKDEAYMGPDKFTGHPQSIDALLVVDDDTVVTGSSDGIVRLLTLQPNKLVGVLGEHDDFPIERLAWSHDKRYIGSAGHDNTVKFWDVAYLFEEGDEEDEEDGAAGAAASDGAAGGGRSRRGKGGKKASKFTSLPALGMPARMGDSDDEDEDSDDEEDDEDEDDSDGSGMDVEDGGAGGRTKAKAAAGSSGGAAGGAGRADDDSDVEMEGGRRRGGKGKGKAAGAGKKKGKGGFFDEL